MTAVVLLLTGLVWPSTWTFNDLASFPAARLALGGARATLTFPAGTDVPLATVVILPSTPLSAAWPDDVAYWNERIVGHKQVLITKAARLTRANNVRTYQVETQSDADAGGQLYTALLIFEVKAEGETRLVLFRFEETAAAYRAGIGAVRALYAHLAPQAARAPKNLK